MTTKELTITLPRGLWGRARVLALRAACSDEEMIVRAVAKGMPKLEADSVLDELEEARSE